MLKKNQQALAHDFATSLPENEENKRTKKFTLPDSGEYSLSLLKDSDEESEPYDQQSFKNFKSIDSKPSFSAHQSRFDPNTTQYTVHSTHITSTVTTPKRPYTSE